MVTKSTRIYTERNRFIEIFSLIDYIDKMKNILIYGLNSFKNRGCEALLLSTEKIIKKQSNYKITAATFDFNYNKKFHNEILKGYVKHYKKESELTKKEKKLLKIYKNMPFDYNNFELLFQKDVVKEINQSDICISIGGDNYCYGYNEWLYALNKVSKERNKKLILWGASLFEEINDLKLVEDLKKYDLLFIRESFSYNALLPYIKKEKMILAPDPAFILETKEIKLNSWYKGRKVIGLNLSPLTINNEESYNSIYKLIDYIILKTEYSVCLIPHVKTNNCSDLEVLEKIYSKYKENDRVFLERKNYNCLEIKYIISKFEFLIASRTHASIAGYSSSVPTLVIGYSIKSKGIAKDIFGNYEEYVISYENLSGDNLILKFNKLISKQTNLRNTLLKYNKAIEPRLQNLFSEVIEKINENDKRTICDDQKCSACAACYNICPVNAITMKKNEEGFLYPNIDLEKCTFCNLCRNICPSNKIKTKYIKEKTTPEAYAAKNKIIEEQFSGSSGGIFSIMASSVIEKSGAIYGAKLNNESFSVNHVRIDKILDIESLKKSKYVQSEISNIYKIVEADLKLNKIVLFSGTPCQISGLKAYLQKEYENLINVQVICHGVMNEDTNNKYLREISGSNDKISAFCFKSKENGWNFPSISYEINNINKVIKFNDSDIMWLYLKNHILRNSCYNCSHKGLNNSGADIIIGDYWGINKYHPDFFDKNGVSALIVRTKKGKEFLKNINFFKKVDFINTKAENIIDENPMLYKSANKPLERNQIFSQIRSNSLKFIVKYYKAEEKIAKSESLIAEKERNFLDTMTIKDKQIINLKKERENLILSNENLNKELLQIINSKRWKLLNKLMKILWRR